MAVSTIDALYNGTSEKLTTSATGITVTGTVAATAYTGDGSALTGVGSPSIDDNGNATAMTITSDEDVLIGKTSSSYNTVGSELLNNGAYKGLGQFTTDGTNALTLNRKSSDGEIAIFRKDGAAVGSTGVVGGNDLYIAGGATGIRFDSDVAKIYPTNGTGAVSNGAVDIGEANFRFKDAYLSGGIYLGGAVAANKLDDYEEGTFSPIISGGSNAGTVTYNTRIGQYTKVGNLVTVWMNINWSSGNGSGSLMVKGLPFSVINTARPVFNVISENVSLASNQLAAGFSNFSDGIIMVRNITGTGATLTLTYDSAGTLFLTGTYPTSA
jgi:hypothetical protein